MALSCKKKKYDSVKKNTIIIRIESWISNKVYNEKHVDYSFAH